MSGLIDGNYRVELQAAGLPITTLGLTMLLAEVRAQ